MLRTPHFRSAGTGMCDQEGDPQEVASLRLFEEGGPGFPKEGPVRGGGIDEAAVMGAEHRMLLPDLYLLT